MKFLSLLSIPILSTGYKINRPIIQKMCMTNKSNLHKVNMSNDDIIIVNNDLPSCQNCIYNKHYKYSNEYTTSLNSCMKFGKKDILTGEINYDYIDLCRKDINKCGPEGKYFKLDNKVNRKIFLHNIKQKIPTIIFSSIIILYISFFVYVKISE